MIELSGDLPLSAVDDGYVALGVFLGYPICCIACFGSDYMATMHRALEDQPVPWYGTGFVPCAHCALTKNAEELRQSINAQRLYSVPFPTMEDPGSISDSATYRRQLAAGVLEAKLRQRVSSFLENEAAAFRAFVHSDQGRLFPIHGP